MFCRKNSRWLIAILYTAFAAAAFACCFLDLPVSKAVVNSASGFGHFFAVYGSLPVPICALCASTILFHLTKRSPVSHIGYLLAGIASVVYAYLTVTHGLDIDPPLWAAMLLIGAIVALAFFSAGLLPRSTLHALKRFAVIAIWTVLLTVALIQMLKLCWGRVRFRDMVSPYTDFTPWFLPQGITGNYSFPSGHASSAATLISFTAICPLIKSKWIRAFIYLVSIGFPVLVAVSRVIIGAHFMSDVLFGCGLAVFIFYSVTFYYDHFTRLYRPAIS